MNDVQVDSRVESIIWKRIGNKSTRQIAEEVGLPVDEVARIKRTLLESVDEISLQQKRQRLMMELDSLAQDARDRAEATDDRNYAGMINASTSSIKTLLTELTRMEKADTSRVEALNQLRIKELLHLMDIVVFKSIGEIAERTGIDEEELIQVFNGHLVEAAKEIEA